MKKVIKILFAILVLFYINISFGADEKTAEKKDLCKIRQRPDILENYSKNLNKLKNNILAELKKQKKPDKTKIDYDRIQGIIIGSFSISESWSSYYSYFYFYTIYPLNNEYISEIWRDYNFLEQQGKTSTKFIDSVYSMGYDNVELDSKAICNGIEGCEYSGKLYDVLGKISDNNVAFVDLYRRLIMGDMKNKTFEISLLPQGYIETLQSYYNENTTYNCSISGTGKGFFERAGNTINEIAKKSFSYEEGFKQWKDAVSMIDGTIKKRDYEKREKDLLKKELSRQGVSATQAGVAIKNLEKYNNSGLSLDNNFITNSFSAITKNAENIAQIFEKQFTQLFPNKDEKEGTQTGKSVNLEQYSSVTTAIKDSITISTQIDTMYQELLPYSNIQDKSSENIQARLIMTHYNLTQIIKNVSGTVKDSQKACNSQAVGVGKCEY